MFGGEKSNEAKPFFYLLIFFSFSSCAWCIPLDNLDQNEELLIESFELSTPSYQALPNKAKAVSSPENKISTNASLKSQLIQGTSLNAEKTIADPPDGKHTVGDDTDFYLFEQEELDAQKPGLEIYQSLAPMLTPEMKKDAKKIWADTADFREAIDFSTKDSESKELILQQSSKEMTLLKGKSLEEIANKNLPPAAYDKKEPSKAMVRELFDGIYDLLRNAFFIIAGVLLIGKVISIVVKKIMAGSEKRKERKLRRHSKGRRKKRHRIHA